MMESHKITLNIPDKLEAGKECIEWLDVPDAPGGHNLTPQSITPAEAIEHLRRLIRHIEDNTAPGTPPAADVVESK